ncbi:hypothetical protein [Oceanimonas smirnovii]|uniref:hypothetical protein n=1 Tax=Oceanimonas smirnovii TaxID=264574 RepID=UPI0003641019|nr:hypothetical protein [Oceanimonas smirnovii]
MDVKLGASAFGSTQAAATFLPCLGLAPNTSLHSLSSANAEQAFIEHDATAAVVLFAPLAMCLQQSGLPPEQAAEHWCKQAEQAIRLVKQQRKQVLLFNAQAAALHWQAFHNSCQARWPEWQTQAPLAKAPASKPFYELMAFAMLQARPALRQLHQQLEALAQPLPESAPLPNLNALAEQMCHGEQALQQQPELQQENTLLQEQLHQVQEALEATQTNLNQANKTVETLRSELQQLTSTHQTQQQQAKAAKASAAEHAQTLEQQLSQLKQSTAQVQQRLQQENTLLLEQLFAVQEALEQELIEKTTQLTAEQQAELFAQQKNKLAVQIAAIRESAWFNAGWYTQTYPDVARSGADPAEHYVRYGAQVGRNPGPGFNTTAYVTRYSDIASGNMNPLYHFIMYGEAEGRKPD